MSTKNLLNAVISALEPLKTSHGVKTIAAYNGELGDLGGKNPPSLTPAVLVNFHADKAETVDQISGSRSVRLILFVLAGNVGSQARAETCADLIDAIRTLVHNKNLGQTLTQPFCVMDAELVLDAPLFLGYALSVETEIYENY